MTEREAVQQRSEAYEANPYFPTLAAKAEAKGFRHAEPWEILDASPMGILSDGRLLYTWAGGCWVRVDGKREAAA